MMHCVCVCVVCACCVCVRVECARVCACACMHVYVSMCVNACVYMCAVPVHVCGVCKYVRLPLYVYMYVCAWCMHVPMLCMFVLRNGNLLSFPAYMVLQALHHLNPFHLAFFTILTATCLI